MSLINAFNKVLKEDLKPFYETYKNHVPKSKPNIYRLGGSGTGDATTVKLAVVSVKLRSKILPERLGSST